jgi:hypothetical protein
MITEDEQLPRPQLANGCAAKKELLRIRFNDFEGEFPRTRFYFEYNT